MEQKRSIFNSKSVLIITAILLVAVLAIVFACVDFQKPSVLSRQIALENAKMDHQGILESFDNAEEKVEGSVYSFSGEKQLDPSLFEEIDNVADACDAESIKPTVKYYFSYDSDGNVITLSAEMQMPGGEVKVDTIKGIGFLNEKNEIDAVMNVEGEGILLSEMRDAGMIENCGWFSRFIKAVVKVAVIATVAVAAVVAVVATAGAAAPAVVAAGIGATAVAATTITTVSLSVAAIAAGVVITASILEFNFENVKYKLAGITDELRQRLQNGLYVFAIATEDGKMLTSSVMINREVASRGMKAGLSVYTYYQGNAYDVAKVASDGLIPVSDQEHKSGYFRHYHRNGRKGAAHAFYGMPMFWY